jgi:hypothetical protein
VRVRVDEIKKKERDGNENANHSWKYINKSGKAVIRLSAYSVDEFSEGLAAFTVLKADEYLYCGYVDKAGNTAIKPRFGDCNEFSEGLALVLLDGEWSYIDKTGNIVLKISFDMAESFRDGLAWVQLGGLDPFRPPKAKYGYVDRSGKVIWTPSN